MINESLMTPKKWQLVRESGSAYWMLTIQKLSDKYFLVQRHGKMGAKWPRSPFFDGIPVGPTEGFDDIETAYRVGEEETQRKCRQHGLKSYRRISDDEEVIIDEKDGRKTVRILSLAVS